MGDTFSRKGMMRLGAACIVALAAACTTNTQVDEQRIAPVAVGSGQSVVVLGRRHNSEYETEPDFVSCVSRNVGARGVRVVPETEFMNAFYPWFEPRTAPMNMKRLAAMLKQPRFAARMQELELQYIVWIDGSTQTTDKKGAMSCAAGPGGAGCLGFGMWEKESGYEASVWDVRNLDAVARISAKSDGTSYMPAIIIPIPLIARVQAAACDGVSTQLQKLFAEQ